MRKGTKIAWGVLGAVAGICALGTLSLGWFVKREAVADLSERMRIGKSIGMPVSVHDLPILIVPDEQNAAPIYLKLEDMLKGPLHDDARAVERLISPEQTADETRAGRGALPKMEPILHLLEGLSNHPNCDFKRDWNQGAGVLFHEFVYMKEAARIELAKGEDLSEHGDRQGYFRCIDAAYRIANDTSNDPVFIALLVRVSCERMILASLERQIQNHQQEPSLWADCEKVIQNHPARYDFRFHLMGEVVLIPETLRSVSNLTDLGAKPGEFGYVEFFFNAPGGPEKFAINYLDKWLGVWKRFPKEPTNWRGFEGPLKELDGSFDRDFSPYNALVRFMGVDYSRSVAEVGVVVARQRLLLAAIAVLRERRQTGVLPVALPSGLGANRMDPFDDKPLRYRKQGDGFIVYSVGADRKDDGGRPRDRNAGDDVTFDEVLRMPPAHDVSSNSVAQWGRRLIALPSQRHFSYNLTLSRE